jgi:hypothetical protein
MNASIDHRPIRGAALAETAIILSFTLMLLFGSMQVALSGYYQMQLDAATFEYSHAYALGANDPAALAQIGGLFPNVPLGNISFTASSPPLTNVPVNFTQWGQLNNRYGGASITRPQRLNATATLNVNQFGFLSANPITFTAGNVEGRNMISDHDDDAQGDPYDSQAVYNSQVNPITQDDQNVPPYYFNFGFMWHCGAQAFGQNCPSQSLETLGMAEYLKDGLDSVDGNYDINIPGAQLNETFAPMSCHQRIFAQIAQRVLTVDTTRALAIVDNTATQFWSETSGATTGKGASIALVYSWDKINPSGQGPLLGQHLPLSPMNGCVTGGPGS